MAKKDLDTRFSKFGTVSFTSITKTNDFVDYLEQGKVMGTRCKGCGLKFFPPRADCYKCLSSDMEWFEVAGKGKLLTFSKLQYGPVGFEGDFPMPSPSQTLEITRSSEEWPAISLPTRSRWAWKSPPHPTPFRTAR
jgi:hypothetical protein